MRRGTLLVNSYPTLSLLWPPQSKFDSLLCSVNICKFQNHLTVVHFYCRVNKISSHHGNKPLVMLVGEFLDEVN